MDSIELKHFSSGLIEEGGIWRSATLSEVSYPVGGNEECFQIEDSSFWFRHRNCCIISLIRRFYPRGAFFDIGGGNGFVSLGLAEAGYDPVLIEPGGEGILNAKKRGLKNLVHGSLQNIEFTGGSIPAAGIFDVLEHVEDELGFLSKISQALASDGLLFVTVPAYTLLWSADDRYAGHFRRYTRCSLDLVLSKAGFSPRFSTYIFSGLVLPIFLLRTIPSILGLRKDSGEPSAVRQHESQGISKQLSDILWRWEVDRLVSGRSIPFGSSVIGVYEKRH